MSQALINPIVWTQSKRIEILGCFPYISEETTRGLFLHTFGWPKLETNVPIC